MYMSIALPFCKHQAANMIGWAPEYRLLKCTTMIGTLLVEEKDELDAMKATVFLVLATETIAAQILSLENINTLCGMRDDCYCSPQEALKLPRMKIRRKALVVGFTILSIIYGGSKTFQTLLSICSKLYVWISSACLLTNRCIVNGLLISSLLLYSFPPGGSFFIQ